MALKIMHWDIGGCEGCSVSMLRSIPMLPEGTEVKTMYTCDNIQEIQGGDLVFISGAVCMDDGESVETLKMLREQTTTVVAFGSCAAFCGITRFSRGGQEPYPHHRSFSPINRVIRVDYSLPGCPPPPQTIRSFIVSYEKNDENRLSLFRKLSSIKKLSGFDLLDEVVLTGLCIGCGACEISCPTNAIRLIDKVPTLITERCIRCGTCYVRCPRATEILVSGGRRE